MASNAMQLGLGGLAAVAIGGAIVLLAPTPQTDGPAELTETATLAPDLTVEPAIEPATPQAAATPDPAPAPATPEVIAAPAPLAPGFDTFRIEPDGSAIVAGRAAPGQLVDIVLNGVAITRAEADGSGNFVAFVSVDPSADPRTLRLLADPEGLQTASAETIIVAPFGMEAPEPAADQPVIDAPVVADAATEDPEPTVQTPAPETVIAETPVEEPEPNIVVGQTPVEDPEPETAVAETPVDDAAPDPIIAQADNEDPAPVPDTSVAEITEDPKPVQETVIATLTEPQEPVQDVVAEPKTAETQVAPQIETAQDTAPIVAEAEPDVADINPDATARVAELDTEIGPDTGIEPIADPQPQAPQVLVADETGVRVLPGPQVLSAVALDTITYDPQGEVVLAGRAQGTGFVQVYIDNQPVTTSRITDTGDWRTDLPEVDTGVYTLRIDEVDADGDVVSRIETPFKREEPEAVAAVMAEDTSQDGFEVAVRTVQTGSTLWAIAKEELGDGILYVAVFEANRDLIRNPDLIYPGQVFRIPEAVQ